MSLGMYLKAEGEWNERANYLELLPKFQARHGFTHPDPDTTDITLLSDMFYLPHSLGETGQEFMDTIDFLFKNDVTDWGRPLHTIPGRHQEIWLTDGGNQQREQPRDALRAVRTGLDGARRVAPREQDTRMEKRMALRVTAPPSITCPKRIGVTWWIYSVRISNWMKMVCFKSLNNRIYSFLNTLASHRRFHYK